MIKSLSVVIPVYNEEDTVEMCIRRVVKADRCGLDLEVIVVDDGSTDGTRTRLSAEVAKQKKSKKNVSFHSIYRKQNGGKGRALRDGFLKSTGDVVLVQDADLEYNPSDYPTLLEPFLEHSADVVFGSRFISSGPHRVLYFWHFVGNSMITLLSNMVTNLNLSDVYTGYKAFRGSIIRDVAKGITSKGFEVEAEMTKKLSRIEGAQFFEVGISYFGRTFQQGKKIRWWDAFTGVWQLLTA